jgi:hypothetical protein
MLRDPGGESDRISSSLSHKIPNVLCVPSTEGNYAWSIEESECGLHMIKLALLLLQSCFVSIAKLVQGFGMIIAELTYNSRMYLVQLFTKRGKS